MNYREKNTDTNNPQNQHKEDKRNAAENLKKYLNPNRKISHFLIPHIGVFERLPFEAVKLLVVLQITERHVENGEEQKREVENDKNNAKRGDVIRKAEVREEHIEQGRKGKAEAVDKGTAKGKKVNPHFRPPNREDQHEKPHKGDETERHELQVE